MLIALPRDIMLTGSPIEWGFMRHKPRKSAAARRASRDTSQATGDEGEQAERDSSATVEPIPPAVCEKQGSWDVVPQADLAEAEPTFMGLLHQAPT